MSDPVEADIPHKLGREEARARIDKGIGKFGELIPGGAVVNQIWEDDRLRFTVQAMGQSVDSTLTVFEDRVHAAVFLPPFLAVFADKLRAKLAKEGPKLLE